MKKILLLALISLFVFPLGAMALTDTQCNSGGGTYSSGICICPTHSSWAGDTCECDYQYTGSKGNCTLAQPDDNGRYLLEEQNKKNCEAIQCAPSCELDSCSTVKKQAYWNGSDCECPTGYYSSLAETKGSSDSSGSGSSGSGFNISLPTIFSTGSIPNPIASGSFADLVSRIIDWIINIALILAPLIVVCGGFIYMTAAGDTNKVSQGKNIILYAVIGFIVVLLAKSLIGILIDLVVK